MRAAIVALALTFAFLAFVPQPRTAQIPGTSSLSGQACIEEYGSCWQGVPGAAITLTRTTPVPTLDDQHTASADDAGWFIISNIQDGTYTMQASHAGFATYSAQVSVSGDSKTVAPMAPQEVTFSGSVQGADGPLQATVEAWSPNGYEQVSTGDDGVFSMELTAGQREFSVRAAGHIALSESRFVDGSDLQFTLEPLPPPDVTLTGTVRDQDDAAVAGATVRAYQYGQEYYHGDLQAITDGQGRYSLGLYEGYASLSVEKDGYAGAWADLEVKKGTSPTQDFEILKYPAKTAQLVGRIVDAGSGAPLKYASISLQSPEYGLYECSSYAGDGGSGGGSEPRPMPVEEEPMQSEDGVANSSVMYPYPYPGCGITVHEDGTFTGNVTPGYTLLSVWYDSWRACSESSSSDGSYSRTCGPDYYGFVGTYELQADAENDMVIRLKARPTADATVSGWVLDDTSGAAITGAQVSFSLQDSYGWGEASTDKDGSYKVRIHSGYVHVYAWADGYLPWQGVVQVGKGQDVPFDIRLREGDSRHGGYCCYGYDYAVAEDGGKGAPSSGAPGSPDGGMVGIMPTAAPSGGDGQAADAFEDLGGGLGAYDADKRAAQLADDDEGSPGVGVLPLLAAIGAMVLLRRRR